MKYEGYKVFITGATSGIGLATAKRFLDEGATVIGLGRNFEKTRDLGERFIPCTCDLNDVDQIYKAVEFVKETFGGELDTFVNNAGLGIRGTVLDVSSDKIDAGIGLLLKPAILFGKELYPLLKNSPKKNAAIVNVASLASRSFASDSMLYNVCKQALVHYTKIQAEGMIEVRCNSVCPGFIDTAIFEREGTEWSREEKEAAFQAMSELIPAHRIGKPEEIANVIAFVCSEDAKYITGADFLVDGGASLRTA